MSGHISIRQTLSDPFEEIQKEVEKSKNLLELDADPDADESRKYGQDVWKRATDFLLRNARHLFYEHHKLIATPHIEPGPDASIDIHWKTAQFELLLNFPADPSLPAGFYGDDYGAMKIKGSISTNAFNQGLVLWLMQHE